MAAVGANEWKGGFLRSTGGVVGNSFMPTTMEPDSYMGMMSCFCQFEILSHNITVNGSKKKESKKKKGTLTSRNQIKTKSN